MTDILLTNYPGHSPVIEFDGAGGISMGDVSRVEISGFEIVGPNRDITKDEALEDRLLHSNRQVGCRTECPNWFRYFVPFPMKLQLLITKNCLEIDGP